MGNSSTTFELAPLPDVTFGAVVTNIDLRSIDDVSWNALYDAWIDYGLLIFPTQHLTRDEQDAFARRFGDLEFTAAPISNIGKDGTIHREADDDVVKSIRGNEGWHHDSTYMPIQSKGAVFSAEIIPTEGAATGFADMRYSYEVLDTESKERIADLSAHHSLYYSQARAGYLPSKTNEKGGYDQYGYHDLEVPLRPLVKLHPVTGRPNLNVGRHAHDIPGLAPAESEALIDALNDGACVEANSYHHEWSVGDAVVWDNRRLMHRATPFDLSQPRRMWHTRIAGDPSSELAINHR